MNDHEDAGASRPDVDLERRRWLRGAALAGGGLLMGGAGAAAQQPARPPVGTYNARSFGAVGNGVADDTAAIQSALDAAARGGGLVTIPAGRYRVSRPLTVAGQDRVDLVGAGWSSVLLHEADEPLLLWKEGVSCRETSVRHLCFTSVQRDKSPGVPVIACLSGAERSFFSHLLFNTEGATMGSGVWVENVMDTTTLEHCLIWGPMHGTGIRVARGSEVRIFGGRIIGVANPFTGLRAGNIGVHLTGNNGGVHIVTTDLIALDTGLKIGDKGAPGNREVFITHATFDSSRHGIWQSDSAYTSVAGCWAASSDDDQVLLDENAHGAILTVAGGTVFNGGTYGRPGTKHGLVARAGSFMLSGVTVRNNQGTGIVVGPAVRDYTVTGCRIVENGTAAVLDGDSYAFTGNVLARNKQGVEDRGGPNKQVSGNAGMRFAENT